MVNFILTESILKKPHMASQNMFGSLGLGIWTLFAIYYLMLGIFFIK
jgi:hypothetical protein